MILGVYAVKDALQGRFMAPTFFDNEEVAIRQFRSNINNIPMWKENAADFQLYKLANFNDEIGEYEKDHHMIVNGKGV